MDHPMTRPPPDIVHPDPVREKAHKNEFLGFSRESQRWLGARAGRTDYSDNSDLFGSKGRVSQVDPAGKPAFRTGFEGYSNQYETAKVYNLKPDDLPDDSAWDWEDAEVPDPQEDAFLTGAPYEPNPELDGVWTDEDTQFAFGNNTDSEETIQNPKEPADLLPVKIMETSSERPILAVGLTVVSACEACTEFDSYNYMHLRTVNRKDKDWDVEIECDHGALFIAFGRFVNGGVVVHRISQLKAAKEVEQDVYY